MEYLESNYQLSPRPLTREGWDIWVAEDHPKNWDDESPFEAPFPILIGSDYNVEVVREKSEEIFERIIRSPILKDNFLLWPELAQLGIVRTLEADFDPIIVGVRYSLRERLQKLHPDVMDWLSADDTHIMMFGHTDVAGDAPKEFNAIIDNFHDLQGNVVSPMTNRGLLSGTNVVVIDPKADVRSADEIPYLLVAIHGYPRVIDAMKLFIDHSMTRKLEYFVRLVDGWDDFEYSREWMLSLMEEC